MKYLVVGGCGFIGSNFTEMLISDGHEVMICDNLSRKGTMHNLKYLQEKFRDKMQFLHLDIRNDFDLLLSLVEKVDVVYHLAAQVAVTTSVVRPREDFEINALGTLNVLEAIRRSQSKPIIIYASTNKVYGEMKDVKVIQNGQRYGYESLPDGVSEDRPLDFHSPYGCSKGTGDQYVRDYSRIYGLKSVVFRQSCIYGPMQYGVEDQGWIAWFTIAALLGKKVTIYGDGKQVRDVLFVKDLYDLWDMAIKNINKVSGETFNAGGGPTNTLSLLELLGMLNKRMQLKVDYTFDNWRPGDQLVYVSNIAKARKLLNWEPRSNVEMGVMKMHDWVKQNINLLRGLF